MTPRQEAKRAGRPRYRGRVCAKHPELEGERRTYNSHCVGCHRRHVKNRFARARLRYLRHRHHIALE
jgi:hypothetical protein